MHHSILAARTDFSIGESLLTTEELVDLAVENKQTVCAMTDTMSVTGMIDFTTRAKKKGIKPIIGCRLRLVDNAAWRPGPGEKKKHMPQAHYLTAYVLTEEGMKAIYRLLSLANSDTNFYYEPKLSYSDLYKELGDLKEGHLAFNLNDAQGIFCRPDWPRIAETIQNTAGAEYTFASIIAIDTPVYGRLNMIAREAIDNGLARPLVTRPALYGPEGADAHEVLGAIANNNKITDGWHKSIFSRDLDVVDTKELAELTVKAVKHVKARDTAGVFRNMLAWAMAGLDNTQVLADMVKYEWSTQPVSLPVMAPDEIAAVKQECASGWKARFSDQVFGHKPTAHELQTLYLSRLKYELSVLERLNFSGYFLLVQEVVRYAKDNGILVGPGRGSVGGSLVAYLMGITDCDPIRFGLLFERFINPDRIDLPDADLDFMSARRHEIIDYLTNKYGKRRVAGVANYGKLAAASAIRDVGRVMGLSERDYSCSKMVPKVHGQPLPLTEAAEKVSEIQALADAYPVHWDIMLKVEGAMRNYSQHAAGIVVAGVDLEERAVLEQRGETNVVCFDKRLVEGQGLVKMDLLGLNTLDVMALALDYIKERTGNAIDLNKIPLDDPAVLEMFAKGETTGIFQFESAGMRALLRNIAASGSINFDEITAATALYRPGPMESGMMDSFHRRKNGTENIEYDHPLMEDILAETYGVIVYQEQVMKISQVIAGYTGAEADTLRKIMGKKEPEKMRQQKDKFVQGCVATIGATERWAGDLFDKIEGFAGYGFNKSHSVEYTLISYQSMWLKMNYGVEFFAAALTLYDSDKIPGLVAAAEKLGISINVPDINISSSRYEIPTGTRLVMPFTAIKGIAETTANAIVAARQAGGPFGSKADLIARVEKRKCNVKHQELLDKVGAFARIETTTPGPNDEARLLDQIELLPGLINTTVRINHEMHHDKLTKEEIAKLVIEYCNAHGPTGPGDVDGLPVRPMMGRKCAFMIVQDCPTHEDDKDGKLGQSRSAQAVYEALETHGIDKSLVYWTSLVKRPKADKQISSEEIKTYLPYLEREIEITNPPVIILLGTGVVRHFLPDLKGKAFDSAGKVIYSKEFDANLVVGFNIGELYYAPEKQEQLNDVFARVVELIL